jgi:hypothetical protein
MPKRTQQKVERAHELAVDAEWCNGPRTAAWDQLWRWILADVLSATESGIGLENDGTHSIGRCKGGDSGAYSIGKLASIGNTSAAVCETAADEGVQCGDKQPSSRV